MAVEWNGDKLQQDIRQAAMIGVAKSIMAVQSLAIQKINQPPKTGRIYRHRSVEHQASAPGEAPATDTGRLAQSTTIEYDIENLAATLFFRTAYAAALEFGTAKIEPRPYARPALAEKGKEIVQNITDEIAKVTQ